MRPGQILNPHCAEIYTKVIRPVPFETQTQSQSDLLEISQIGNSIKM